MSARKQIGRFRIDEVLGYGGMGVVYRAHDLKLDRAVAIKVLPNISIDEGNPRPRLEQEARTLARFNHPNIASIYGLGETDDGSTYLVLELAEGQTLDERLRDSLPSVEQALQICRQVAAALLAAHERGVIHRDLKPQNVSIVREGMVKVLDFGLAKRVDAPSSPPAASTKAAGETVELSAPATEAGVIQGTPGYMSPEQIRGRNVDLRTDIFAFGCLLFECLTGTRAFPGDSLRTIFAATLSADPDWSLLPGEAPRGIRDLLRRCLEKDPERRLLDISEALSVLEEELGATASPSAEASAEVTFSHNLPTCLSSFVGRVRELNDVMELLKRSRLVTLTGSGGCGKTRLALRLAEELLPAYQDGVWLVELAAVSNQSQAPGALLNALKLREQPREPVLRTILESLEKQQALLIFDNCEHLLGACARIAEAVLQGCPQVKVIATSREGLGIPGETIYLVPSLSTAENIASPSARELEPYESVQLFLERAAAARPGFSLVDENAPHIARICHRLNGIPLAIELAATRLRAMALEQIAGRLEDNFRLLMSGSPTALPRHQTMRAAFDWSYNLLSAEEQLLLRRLSLFAGGWTLEAAESVCSDGSLEEGGELAAEGFPERIPDLLTSLVEKSLVIYADTPDGGGRYHLLQTGRQYAREELERSDGCDTARDRHISFFLALAEEAEPELRGPRQKAWLDRLEIEHENIKAALEWSRSAKDGDRKRLRLIGAIWRFWLIHGHFEYGSALLEEILREYEPAHRSRLWAGVHHGAGALSSIQGDHAAARARFQESLAIHRKLGDKRGIANMLGNLGLLASEHADYASASALYEESLGIFRELGDERGIAIALGNLGVVARKQGSYEAAQSLYEESLGIHRKLGNNRGIAIVLVSLGSVAEDRGALAAARSLYHESLEIFRALGDRRSIATTLDNLGNVAVGQGDIPGARALHVESLGIYRSLGDRRGVAIALLGLSQLAGRSGETAEANARLEECLPLVRSLDERPVDVMALEAAGDVAAARGELGPAAQLFGAAAALRDAIGERLNPQQQRKLRASTGALREELGDQAFAQAWAAGGALSSAEALGISESILRGP